MADVKVGIYELDGVELLRATERDLNANDVTVDPAIDGENKVQQVLENMTAGKKDFILTMGKKDDFEDVWLDFYNKISSNKTHWSPPYDCWIDHLFFSNHHEGTSGDPMVTKIYVYEKLLDDSGDFTTSDTLFFSQLGDNSLTRYGDFGRLWYAPITNKKLLTTKKYGFRCEHISGDESKIDDAIVNFFLREA